MACIRWWNRPPVDRSLSSPWPPQAVAQRARLDKDLAKADHPARMQPTLDDTLSDSGGVSVADPSSSVSRYISLIGFHRRGDHNQPSTHHRLSPLAGD